MDRRFSRRGYYRTSNWFGRQMADAAPYFSSEAYHHLRKLAQASKVDLCSTSSNDSTTKEDSSSYELHRSLCDKSDGLPQNKRTDEMVSKVVERGCSSPSVIARLMGLDELHPQVSELKIEDEHFLLKKSSAELQNNLEGFGNHSFLVSRRKCQNFKIVPDLCDSSKAKHINKEKCYSKPNMAFIKQQFMQTKLFSRNEALQNSKEVNDVVGIVDSHEDISLKFLQGNSLFAKQLHPLKYSKSVCHTSHFKISESSADNTRKSIETSYKTVEESKGCIQKKKVTVHGCENLCTSLDNCFTYDDMDSLFPNMLRSQNVGKQVTSCPTSIVVLKPNVQKVKITGRTKSCPRPLQNFKRSRRRNSKFHQEVLVERGEQHQLFHINSKGCKTKATTEIARDVSPLAKQSLKRYSKVALASRINIYNSSSTCMSELSFSREALNGLSEQHKTAEPSRHRLIGEGSSTLCEMLSFYDKAPKTLGQHIFKDLSDKIVDKEYLHDSWAYNSVTSSSNGWKDECDAFLPGSEDHSKLFALYGSSNPKKRHHVGCSNPIDDCNTLKDILNQDQNEQNNLMMDREHSMLRNFEHRDKNPDVFIPLGEGSKRHVKEVEVCKEAYGNVINLNNLIEPKPVYLQRNLDGFLHLVQNYSIESDESFLFNLKEFQQSAKHKDLSVIVLRNVIPEIAPVDFPLVESPLDKTQSGAFIEPKVAERLSPVSVLDPQAEDGNSTPEFLEIIRAGLHDLRRQLNLLQLETVDSGDAQSKALMFNDEAGREMLNSLKDGGGRDFLYLFDILTVSGIYASSQNKFFDACYLSHNPVFPDVFDKLEKKYSMVNSWSRSERRLLFDHINSVLAEVLAPCLDIHPWVKSRTIASCGHGRLVNESWRLLVRQHKELSKGRPEDKVLDTRWLYLDDHIDMIGREIERMLKDDLLNELVSEFISG